VLLGYVSIGRSRRRAIRPKQSNAGPWSAFRTSLDFRIARIAYRALRAAWREACWFTWELFYGDDEDRAWVLGVAAVCVLLAILLSLPW
jgi:hypothetical protein